jgi:Holliday junction resolvase
MSASSKGAQREHAVKRMLEADGWVIAKTAGSKTCVDIWAMRRNAYGRYSGVVNSEVMAIQVKGNAGSPWMNFRSIERADLGLLAAKAGATPWLIHWPPHGECRWYPESEWPEAKVAA